MKKISHLTITFLVLITVLLLVISLHLLGASWTLQHYVSSCQPRSTLFTPESTYCLTIVEKLKPLGTAYNVVIVNQQDEDYRFILNYPNPANVNTAMLTEESIQWSDEGVSVVPLRGVRLFIPKEEILNHEY